MITVPSQCMLVVFHQTLLFSTLPLVSIVLLNARKTGELFEFDWTNWYNGWFSYVRNVEYGKYHEPIYRTLEKFSQSTGNQDIDIAAFQVWNFYRNLWLINISALFSVACHNCAQSNWWLHHESICFWAWWCCWYRSWRITLHHREEWVFLRRLWVKWVFSNRWSDWYMLCYNCKATKAFNQDVVWFENISKTVSLRSIMTVVPYCHRTFKPSSDQQKCSNQFIHANH